VTLAVETDGQKKPALHCVVKSAVLPAFKHEPAAHAVQLEALAALK